MTKVCHVTSVHNRYDPRIFHKECMSLANAGYDVTLLVADGKADETRNGVKITAIDFKPKNRIDRILHSGAKLLDKALEIDAEIYHLHDPELLPLGKNLKRHGKKVIFDSHEDVAGQILGKKWIPAALRKPLSVVYSVYSSALMKNFDALIGVTPSLVDKLKAINPMTVMVTNYPIITEDIAQNICKYKEPTFVFAGGISEQWCHEKILNALENIDVKYLLMGSAQESYLQKLKTYPAWDRTEYLGSVPHETVKEKLPCCYAGFSVLLPSDNTAGNIGTLGNNKLFEQMQAGLPVICTDFVLWKQIIDKYHCGITVTPTNVEEIANAIRRLLDHPEEAKQMGENGRRAVKEEFNWNIEEKKLLKLYEEI